MNSSRPNKNQQHKKNSNELSELEQEKAKVFEEEDEKKKQFQSEQTNEWANARIESNCICLSAAFQLGYFFIWCYSVS